jgi:hypothetical protein
VRFFSCFCLCGQSFFSWHHLGIYNFSWNLHQMLPGANPTTTSSSASNMKN